MVYYFNRNSKNGNGNGEDKEKSQNKSKSSVSSWLTGKVACFTYGVVGGYLLYRTGLLEKMVKKLGRSKSKEPELQPNVSSNSSN